MIIFDNPAPREAWDPSIPNIIGARELDDILVFIPGVAEEKQLYQMLRPLRDELVASNKPGFDIIRLKRQNQ